MTQARDRTGPSTRQPISQQTRADALRVLRALRGLTQRELARAAGINKATISAYERGRQTIGSDNLDALLSALDVTPRAWEATVRHVAWVNHLTTGGRDALEAEALRMAESVSRDFELGVSALLRLILALSGREEKLDSVDARRAR